MQCVLSSGITLSAGRLYKLDMSSYGLTCPFPVKEFSSLLDLESLDLSDNFDLAVSRHRACLDRTASSADVRRALVGHAAMHAADVHD